VLCATNANLAVTEEEFVLNQEKSHIEDDAAAALVAGRAQSFEWAVQRMPGVVYRCAADSQLTMCALTHGVAELLGYPASDFLDNAVRSYADVIHPDDRAEVVTRLAEILDAAAAQSTQLEYRVVTADARERWVQHKAWVVRDDEGRPAWLEGFIFDVTEHRLLQLAEQQRRVKHEQQQRALVALATAAAGEGSIVEVAMLATECLVSTLEIERASVWLLDQTRSKLEQIDLYVRTPASHEQGATLPVGDFPVYFTAMRSGRVIDADDAAHDPRTSEFFDSYLHPLGITAMLDATIRIGSEVVGTVCLEQVGPPHAWQSHEIEFAGEVGDQISLALHNRARAEGQAREQQLQEQLLHAQKMDALGRLAGGIAHDFNNLLMIIGGSAELLDMRLEDATLRSSAQDIITASRRAGELTEQLLSFSRQQPLARYKLDLCAVVGKLERMLRRLLGRGINLEVEIPDEPVFVCASEGLIQQILTNLVVNARDAVSHDPKNPGHIEITVEVIGFTQEITDLAEPVPPGRYASLCVADNGVGMAPEVRARVFEPFFTTKPAGQGTGLGLATVYSIARRCDGMVKITSEAGKGSSVYVLLPIVEVPA
jgi:PAS domain S-box-containing protein